VKAEATHQKTGTGKVERERDGNSKSSARQ